MEDYFIGGNNSNLHIQFFIINSQDVKTVLIKLLLSLVKKIVFNEKKNGICQKKKIHTTTLRIAKIMSYN